MTPYKLLYRCDRLVANGIGHADCCHHWDRPVLLVQVLKEQGKSISLYGHVSILLTYTSYTYRSLSLTASSAALTGQTAFESKESCPTLLTVTTVPSPCQNRTSRRSCLWSCWNCSKSPTAGEKNARVSTGSLRIEVSICTPRCIATQSSTRTSTGTCAAASPPPAS